MWIQFKDTAPDQVGYYYVEYLHKDGQVYYKSIWWNKTEFKYKDYVKEVYRHLPECHQFYCPCESYARHVLQD